MTTVYHEVLPKSYLLILAPGQPDDREAELDYWLRRARRSGKSAVWVDCGMLTALSSEAARLLWDAHFRLQAEDAELVLVHVADAVKRTLLDRELGPAPSIERTLLDAARHSRQFQMA